MKRLAKLLAAATLVLAVVVLVNAYRAGSGAVGVTVSPIAVAVDSSGALDRLAAAVQVPTVSYDEVARTDSAAFRRLHQLLRTSFPRVHATLKREVIAGLSLHYTWFGIDTTLPPVVLMGHLDVVPVIPGTESRWEQPPFSGARSGGYVWGRGALDDKVSVLAILEAVESALADGVQPLRTVHLAFGHDEESGGAGARAIRDSLVSRGIKTPALVLDEGGALVDGAVVGIPGKAAMIAVAEKGFLSLELTVQEPGGHSSTPPRQTAIGRLAQAIVRLENDPFPATLDGPSRTMLETMTPRMSFGSRIFLANLWLFAPVVKFGLLQDPQTAAMFRTTTAPTIIGAGVKANVLPIDGRAVVNFRLRPGDTQQGVIERVIRVIADTGVHVAPLGFATEPSPVSDHTGPGFALIEKSLRESYPADELTVLPFLVMGGTDAKYWSTVTDQTFRFVAAPLEKDALTRVHGTNERIAESSYLTAVRFFSRLLRNL